MLNIMIDYAPLMTGIKFDVDVLEKKVSVLIDTLQRERDRLQKLADPLFIKIELTESQQDRLDMLEEKIEELDEMIGKLESVSDSLSDASLELM